MKGVQGVGGGTGDEEDGNEEVREELELALSLGWRSWHLPPRQEPAPSSHNRTAVLPEWNPDAAGSSHDAKTALGGQSIPSLRFRDMLGGILDASHAGGSVEVGWGNLDEEDEDRDLQNKRLRVNTLAKKAHCILVFYFAEKAHFILNTNWNLACPFSQMMVVRA